MYLPLTSKLPSRSRTIGLSIVLLAQSYSMLAPVSVTSRRICCPPHTPFANLLFVSTGAVLTAASLLRQEPPPPSIVRSTQTASDGNIRFSVLIDSRTETINRCSGLDIDQHLVTWHAAHVDVEL